MTSRRYKTCQHCAQSKPVQAFSKGNRRCNACEQMIASALRAQLPGVTQRADKSVMSRPVYVPPVWQGR